MGRHLTIRPGLVDSDNALILELSVAVPASGTSGTGAADWAAPNCLVRGSGGAIFVNEGTLASPYWTPVSYTQRGLLSWFSDFRDGVGKADANTDATTTVAGSGLRIHGQGIAETDSGVTVTMSDQGAVADCHTTDEAAHTIVLSVGAGTTPVFQPDQNGTCVVDVVLTNSSAITERALFVGFCGSAADALDPIVTGSTTTISFAATVGDDVAGLYFDTGLTDGDRLFAPHDKGNANASIATTATGVDTGVDIAAAGTYQRLRVECSAGGAVTCFVDKAQVASFAAGCLDADEEIQPMCYLESNAASVKSLLVKQFGTWGARA